LSFASKTRSATPVAELPSEKPPSQVTVSPLSKKHVQIALWARASRPANTNPVTARIPTIERRILSTPSMSAA
jgi:hypothetical protein